MRFAVVDSETDPFLYGRIPEPFIWGVWDEHGFTCFDYLNHSNPTKAFVDYISNFNGHVYAHNGGKFDWHFCLPYINTEDDIKIINGRLSSFKIGKATCRDSLNLLPLPLSALKKDDFDYSKMEAPVRGRYMNEIRRYLKHDCEYLYEYLEKFFSEYGTGLTLAGLAMKQWRKICNAKNPKGNSEFHELFRQYYFGGRVTPFKTGIFKREIKVVDINSAYPTAMCDVHPWGHKPIQRKRFKDSWLPMSFLTVECVSRGALPIREKNGSIDFPCDSEKRIYNVTGHEFIAGLETGTIDNVKILNGYHFKDGVCFKEYVDHFYAKKLQAEHEGDKAGRTFAKLFLNSLYGKFATNPEKFREYLAIDQNKRLPKYKIVGENGVESWQRWRQESIWQGNKKLISRPIDSEEMEASYYNLATSASITGWVRAYLWRSICQCDTPYYCDTDSIICEGVGQIPLGEKLGEWDLEAECDSAAIAGKKLYSVREKNGKFKTACKGVRLTPQEIYRVAMGETVTYKSDAPTFSINSEPSFCTRKVTKTA